MLDHDIPENYIPVLGGDELYMEIDENGNIIRYRHRTLQADGSWIWETVDPNIPENYEPVPGLENVYKVTGVDGNVHYYKYTRNSDDTYFFTEVDENGNPLEDYVLTEDEIPANYVRVDGTNIYAVYNEYGVLVGYRERVQNEDGTYSWGDVDPPSEEPENTVEEGDGALPGVTAPPAQQQTSTTQQNPSAKQNQTSQPQTPQENLTSASPSVEGSSPGGNITINGGTTGTQKGYTEEKIYTDTKHEDGWIVVYETVVHRTYDSSGNLVSTKTDGPNEINRFPETEISGDILSGLEENE